MDRHPWCLAASNVFETRPNNRTRESSLRARAFRRVYSWLGAKIGAISENLVNRVSRFLQFCPCEFKKWWTYASATHASFRLRQLDQLHELCPRVHAQYREKH